MTVFVELWKTSSIQITGASNEVRHMAPINMKLSPPGHDSPSDRTYWPSDKRLFSKHSINKYTVSKFFFNLFLKLFKSLELCSQFAGSCNWLFDICTKTKNTVWIEDLFKKQWIYCCGIRSCQFLKIYQKWGLEGAKDQETISWAKTCRPLIGWGQLKRFPRNCNKWNRMWIFQI